MWKRRNIQPEGSFLFVRPSALRGLGMLLDIRGSLTTYNISPSPAAADARAQRADWLAVARDLREAFGMLHEEAPHAPRPAA